MDSVRIGIPVVFNHGSRYGQGAQSSSSTLKAPTLYADASHTSFFSCTVRTLNDVFLHSAHTE